MARTTLQTPLFPTGGMVSRLDLTSPAQHIAELSQLRVPESPNIDADDKKESMTFNAKCGFCGRLWTPAPHHFFDEEGHYGQWVCTEECERAYRRKHGLTISAAQQIENDRKQMEKDIAGLLSHFSTFLLFFLLILIIVFFFFV
jgi:hypothetical protein